MDILIRDAESKMRLRPKGGGNFNVADNMTFSGIYILGIRNQAKRVAIILRQKNDQGVLVESASWEVENP
jgi:hypothetical protein